MKKFQPTHLVKIRPWPIIGSSSAIIIIISFILIINKNETNLVLITIIIIMLIFFSWRKDILSESSLEGEHLKKTLTSLKTGMILFIISEIFLFISIFWAFFHSSLSPSVDIGLNWPPNKIETFNYREIPILNTIILISSGATLTFSHHFLLKKEINKSIMNLMLTVRLGLIFTLIQLIEYLESKFSINDSVFGSSFFITTGLHGAHVIIGSIFIIVVINQINNIKSIPNQFIRFDLAAWYWHFVDVVWLFLLISVYWWRV